MDAVGDIIVFFKYFNQLGLNPGAGERFRTMLFQHSTSHYYYHIDFNRRPSHARIKPNVNIVNVFILDVYFISESRFRRLITMHDRMIQYV